MARVTSTFDLDREELDRRCLPRDDHLVREVAVAGPAAEGTVAFTADHGPFLHYDRRLRWQPAAPGADRYAAVQDIEFRLAIPFFAPIFTPLMRRSLPDGLAAGRQVWWNVPNRLSAAQSSSLGAMCVLSYVAGMLYAFLTNVLTFASVDIGNGTAAEQTALTAATRIGVVITFVLMTTADRVGRRRVAVWTALAAVGLTAASALSPSLMVLGVLQTVSRNLAITSTLAADTIVVEELPAGSRAAASGLGALSWGAGAGVVVLALPLADLGPAGWRLVFAVSLLALPLVLLAARNLPESRRFIDATRTDPRRRARIRPGRFVLLAVMFFLVNMIVAPSSQLQNDYLRADRGFAASRISIFVILTATPALFGVLAGSRIADRRGRKVVLLPGLLVIGVFTAAFFLTSGAVMWIVAILGALLGTVAVPALGVLAPELFPTTRRGQARGGVTAVATAGSAVGLLLAGTLVDTLGYGPAFTWLALAPILAGVLSVLLPETKGLELETLNEETGDPGPAIP